MRDNEDLWFESLKNQILSNNSNFFLRLACLLSPSAISKFAFGGGRAGDYVSACLFHEML